jgi:hypothetical protein
MMALLWLEGENQGEGEKKTMENKKKVYRLICCCFAASRSVDARNILFLAMLGVW